MKKFISAACTDRSMNWDMLCRSLLQYRNTPSRRDGLSPAQKLFGRPVQDHLPAHRRSFSPEWQKSFDEAENAAEETQQESQNYYNAHAHNLPDITIGSHVAIQHHDTKRWEIYGTVTAIGPYRCYHIKTRFSSATDTSYASAHHSPSQHQLRRLPLRNSLPRTHLTCHDALPESTNVLSA